MKTVAAALGMLWLLSSSAPTAGAAGTPEQQCVQAKLKAAGKKLGASMNCHAKAKGTAVPVDSSCLAKADTKFSTAITTAGNACAGTSEDIGSAVESCVGKVLTEIPGDGDCPAGSTKAAGKAGRRLLVCRAKEVTKPDTFLSCHVKMDDKLTSAIAKAGSCADGPGLHDTLHECHDSIDGTIEPPPATTTSTTSSTTTTTTTTSTSTTTLPLCPPGAVIGDPCGSCATGQCLSLCEHTCPGGALVCVDANTGGPQPCTTDAACPSGMRCFALLCGAPPSGTCGSGAFNGCASLCP